jgi:hypothetical protein
VTERVLRPSIITYDGLPVSSGGAHRLHPRNSLAALQQLRHFLVTCTDTPIPAMAFVEVVRGASFVDDFSVPLIERLTAKLGVPTRRHAGSNNIAHRWNLKADQIDAYVAMIEHARPLPVDPYGLQPFVVAAHLSFRLLKPNTDTVLPAQDSDLYGCFLPSPGQLLGTSQLFARISGRSTISLFLNFPFEEQTDEFLDTAAHVQAGLPFPLSQKHWKHWRLTKKGTGYLGRRINVQVQAIN